MCAKKDRCKECGAEVLWVELGDERVALDAKLRLVTCSEAPKAYVTRGLALHAAICKSGKRR